MLQLITVLTHNHIYPGAASGGTIETLCGLSITVPEVMELLPASFMVLSIEAIERAAHLAHSALPPCLGCRLLQELHIASCAV